MEQKPHHNWLAPAFLWLATAYFVIGILFGIGMAMTHNFVLLPSHAHINLLGWVSLGMFGCIYKLWPALSASRLGLAHFWIYNLALPPMMIFLVMYKLGNVAFEQVLGAMSMLVAIGVLSFAANVFRNLR